MRETLSSTQSIKLNQNWNKHIAEHIKIVQNAKENYNKIKQKINFNKFRIESLLSTSKEILRGKSVESRVQISQVVAELSKLICQLEAIKNEFKVFEEFFNILVKDDATNELQLSREFSNLQNVTKCIYNSYNTPTSYAGIENLCKDSQYQFFEPRTPPPSPTLSYHNYGQTVRCENNLSRQSTSKTPPRSDVNSAINIIFYRNSMRNGFLFR